jgi:hypothetical protein
MEREPPERAECTGERERNARLVRERELSEREGSRVRVRVMREVSEKGGGG